MLKARVLILLTCTLLFQILFKNSAAQSSYFRNYSVDDGLPFVEVAAIFQDSKGNLWSGGYGGLSKFDGIQFTNYTPEDGLLNHAVTSICEDNQNNIWIGTVSGINKFDGEKFTGYTTKDGLVSNLITAIIKDKNGDLWFGTDKGIVKWTNGKFTNFSTTDGLVSKTVTCLYEDKSGRICIGTTNGLSIIDPNVSHTEGRKRFENYTIENGLLSNTINGITQDFENNYWIATANGLSKLSNNKFTGYTRQQGLVDNDLKSIITDYKNNIWLATNVGLVKFENERFHTYSISKDPNSNIASCLYQDYEHNLWIGTYTGLFKYRGDPFISFGIQEGLSNNFIFGIIRDNKNTLWVGSQGGGVFKYENNHFTQFNNKNGLKANDVKAIYEYSPGVLWLGTETGLFIYDGKAFTKKNDPSGVFSDRIYCFYKDSKNNIWMGSNNQVFKYDGSKFTRYNFKARSENFQVWSFAEDLRGTLWIGTYLGGLIKYDGKTFVECGEQIGFKNDSPLTALVDKEGYLYFGSLDGVWMFNPTLPSSKLVSFKESDGLSSNLVYALTFGKTQNEIWVGTNQGLNQIDIATFKKNGQKNIIPHGKYDGFSGVESNTNGNWVDKDGSIWFGTVNGLVKYDPNEYIENQEESKITITGFRLFYKDTVLSNQIQLPYSTNNIAFKYSGICLTNPEKVKYSHILEGFEKNWSPPSKERLATYSNLPPGTYTFKVKSSNNEKVWNEVPASFTFTINTPIWKTWWFRFTSIVIIICVFLFFIRYRIRKIKDREKRKTELNKKIAQIESQALRAQMNPHFIFNTLSSIQYFISNNDSAEALKYLSKFAKLMRKIMDNSKQQMISVAEEIDALDLYLELEVMRFDKKFKYEINVDSNIEQNYDRIPSMLIQPYVENAIIHGLLPKEESGKIIITLRKQEDTILCSIEDNGVGREKSKEFQGNRVKQHKSMGMSITKERLSILNSTLNSTISFEIIDLFADGKAVGTRVNLVIPLEVNENN